jgi:hypothetical protein
MEELMAIARGITAFDIVELTDSIDDAPAGAQGGVLELRGRNKAMVEITKPPLDGAARIVIAPLDKLRIIEQAR